MSWRTVCRQVVEERGVYCEISGMCGDDIHHAIINRQKGVKELDDPRNLLIVNRAYHKHSDAARRDAWKRNCKRYGKSEMINWLNSVPLKIKPSVDWLDT